jgi:hypothetical protein
MGAIPLRPFSNVGIKKRGATHAADEARLERTIALTINSTPAAAVLITPIAIGVRLVQQTPIGWRD